MKLFVGTLKLFIGRKEFLVGRLQLRVDALEFCHSLFQVVLRYMQVFLQVRDPLRGCGIDLILLRIDLAGLLIRAQKSENSHPRFRAQPVAERLSYQRDRLAMFPDLHRNALVGHPFLLLPGLLECLGNSYLELRLYEIKNIQSHRTDRQRNKFLAVSVCVDELVLLIHQDARRHQHLQDAGIQFCRIIRQIRFRHIVQDPDGAHILLHFLHRIGNMFMGGRLA